MCKSNFESSSGWMNPETSVGLGESTDHERKRSTWVSKDGEWGRSSWGWRAKKCETWGGEVEDRVKEEGFGGAAGGRGPGTGFWSFLIDKVASWSLRAEKRVKGLRARENESSKRREDGCGQVR